MPRERAKLTDKQERILVQAQLMGLTPRDMQQIGNRLVALKKEAEDKAEISESISGYSWTKDKDHWVITTPEGYVVKFIKGKTGRSSYYHHSWDYHVTIDKPGTAFKTRRIQKNSINIRQDWRSRLCPENSKELYAMIKWLSAHLNYILRQK